FRPELFYARDEGTGARRMFRGFVGIGEGGFELFQQLALLAGQAHRRFHHHPAEQIAGATAAHRFHPLPAQPEHMPALGFRWNADGRLAIQRGHFDVRAERRLRKTHRHFAVQVIALALENLVLAHMHFHVQIARRGTRRTSFALAREPNAIAVVHAGRDAHRQRAFVLQATLAVTSLARSLDHATGTAAMRAGLLDRENAVLHPHPPVTAAGRADDCLAIGGARTVAVMAVDQRGNLDLLFDSGDGFFQIELHHVTQISATRGTPAAAEDVGKDVAEDVADIAEPAATAAPTHAVLERGVSVLVVQRAALRIAEHVPGFLRLLEAFLGLRIVGAAIRMAFHRHLAKGFLDLFRTRGALDIENFVIATFLHGLILSSIRRSGTSHIIATTTNSASDAQVLTNASGIDRMYSSIDNLPLRSWPTARANTESLPSCAMMRCCKITKAIAD